ncbi:hypothetical protein H0H93_004336 [Arthromyces matolae]|nr:hypothetical protein H0H93_004336 [Arthromyces matolae]
MDAKGSVTTTRTARTMTSLAGLALNPPPLPPLANYPETVPNYTTETGNLTIAKGKEGAASKTGEMAMPAMAPQMPEGADEPYGIYISKRYTLLVCPGDARALRHSPYSNWRPGGRRRRAKY